MDGWMKWKGRLVRTACVGALLTTATAAPAQAREASGAGTDATPSIMTKAWRAACGVWNDVREAAVQEYAAWTLHAIFIRGTPPGTTPSTPPPPSGSGDPPPPTDPPAPSPPTPPSPPVGGNGNGSGDPPPDPPSPTPQDPPPPGPQATPEPASLTLGLLGAGAATFAAWRKRRRQAA